MAENMDFGTFFGFPLWSARCMRALRRLIRWAGAAIVAMSVPLFWLVIWSGKQIYDQTKEAQKYQRRADYLKDVLQKRYNVEERTLFGYTGKVNRQWLEKFEAALKITVKVDGKYFLRLKASSLITVFLSLRPPFCLRPI